MTAQQAFDFIKKNKKFLKISKIETFCNITPSTLNRAILRNQLTFTESEKLVKFMDELHSNLNHSKFEFYFQSIGGDYDFCDEYIFTPNLQTAIQVFTKKYSDCNMLSIRNVTAGFKNAPVYWKQGSKIDWRTLK